MRPAGFSVMILKLNARSSLFFFDRAQRLQGYQWRIVYDGPRCPTACGPRHRFYPENSFTYVYLPDRGFI